MNTNNDVVNLLGKTSAGIALPGQSTLLRSLIPRTSNSQPLGSWEVQDRDVVVLDTRAMGTNTNLLARLISTCDSTDTARGGTGLVLIQSWWKTSPSPFHTPQ